MIQNFTNFTFYICLGMQYKNFKSLLTKSVNPLQVVLVVAFMSILPISCHKDQLSNEVGAFMRESTPGYPITRGGSNSTNRGVTVIGEKLDNPYSVTNMTAAWNVLYEPDVTKLPATHLYVKFLPSTFEEMELLDSLNLNLTDTPLDHEILVQGSHYCEPGQAEDGFQWLYAVVPVGYVLPNVQHELIEEIIVAKEESYLVRESFRITGNIYDPDPTFIWPAPPTVPPCDPSSPNWPDCANPPGEVQYTTSACGCQVYNDEHKPGGCIKVLDTQFGLVPARRVNVTVRKWFSTAESDTDDDGCFKINEPFNPGPMLRMHVRFVNNRAKIRCLRNFHLWEYAFVVNDPFFNLPFPFNNMEIQYLNDPYNDSDGQRYWISATTNNQIHEYFDYAQQDGVTLPPTQLKILCTTWQDAGEGTAPMLDKAFNNFQAYLGGVAAGAVVDNILGPTIPIPIVPAFTFVATYRPDVVIGYGVEDNNGEARVLRSDQIANTVYHEMGHASHFAQAGSVFWRDEILYILTAGGGYGTPGTVGGERSALIESWGYFIGPTYAERRYGLLHSNTLQINLLEEKRFINLLERSKFYEYFPEFIPTGLLHDLRDINSGYPGATNSEPELFSVNDDVTGFTIQRIFNALTSDVESLAAFKLKVNILYPAQVIQPNYDVLFNDYGY